MSAVLEPIALLLLGTLTYVVLFKSVAFYIGNHVPINAKRYEVSLRLVLPCYILD